MWIDQRFWSRLGSEFGISDWRLLRAIWKPSQGMRLTGMDQEGALYLVKECPEYLSSAEFGESVLIQQALAASGAPIVAPELTRTQCPTAGVAGRWFNLQCMVPRERGVMPCDDFQLGGALARVRRASYVTNMGRFTGDWSRPEARRRWMPDGVDDLLGSVEFLGRSGASSGLIAALYQIAEASAASVPRSGLPSSFIHGDASPDNAVIDVSGNLRLVDLDEVRWADSLFDLCLALFTVGLVRESGAQGSGRFRSAWNHGRAGNLLRGYLNVCALSETEVRALPGLLALVVLRGAVGELDLDDPAYEIAADATSDLVRVQNVLEGDSIATPLIETVLSRRRWGPE